jgi:8-oxo-dGTP pyrophosphatase MutT (NUDIX family)
MKPHGEKFYRIPPQEYYESLAKVPTAGGAIFRNSKGEFLILKLTYKYDWHISGGMTEKGETPKQAVIREIYEELGIKIKKARLFCVDAVTEEPYDRLLFIFDCGILSDKMIKSLKLDPKEVEKYEFVSAKKMYQLLAPKAKKRFKNSFKAFSERGIAYLENGNLK